MKKKEKVEKESSLCGNSITFAQGGGGGASRNLLILVTYGTDNAMSVLKQAAATTKEASNHI